jgi:hypothetical protein
MFIFCRLCSRLDSCIHHRNVPLARRPALKDTGPQFNARRASAPRLSTSTALEMGIVWGSFLLLLVKLKRRSSFLTPLRGPPFRMTPCRSILAPRHTEMLWLWIPPPLTAPLTLVSSRSSKSWKCRSFVHNITRYVELKLMWRIQ